MMVSLIVTCSSYSNIITGRRCQDPAALHPSLLSSKASRLQLTADTSSYPLRKHLQQSLTALFCPVTFCWVCAVDMPCTQMVSCPPQSHQALRFTLHLQNRKLIWYELTVKHSQMYLTGGAYCFTTTHHQRAILILLLELLIVTKLLANDI